MNTELQLFEKSYCHGGMCSVCRQKDSGRMHREQMVSRFPGAFESVDFDCPSGRPWGSRGKKPQITSRCHRAKITLGNAASAAVAIARGRVSEEESQERLQACRECDQLCTDDKGDFCGVCGCAVGGNGTPFRMVELTLYKEGLTSQEWLCKHPERKQGKGWAIL